MALVGDLIEGPLVKGGGTIHKGLIHDVLVPQHGEVLRVWSIAQLELHVSLALLLPNLLDVHLVAVVYLLRLRILPVIGSLLRAHTFMGLSILEALEDMVHIVLAVRGLWGPLFSIGDDALSLIMSVGLESLDPNPLQVVHMVV